MPISDFGKAYLRGLGWEEGASVGKNDQEVIEPIEYVPRPDKLGLGANPKPQDNRNASKQFIKPGESREAKKDMIYVDDQGRQRHVKRVGDKLVERAKTGFSQGALVAVTDGVHKGLYGRIVSTGGVPRAPVCTVREVRAYVCACLHARAHAFVRTRFGVCAYTNACS